jgi:arylsulfatase A-like enzyme
MVTRSFSTTVTVLLAVLLLALCVAAARGEVGRSAVAPAATRPSLPLRPVTRPVRQITRVVVISVDGLRPDVLLRAYAPNVRALMRSGSFTMWARTTAVAVTLPSHVSMMTGVTPGRHGIAWNSALPLTRPVYPKGRTLMEIAKAYGYTTAMVAGKAKFEIFNRPGALDWCWVAKEKKQAATRPAGDAAKPTPDAAEEEWPDNTKKAAAESLADSVVADHAVAIIEAHRPQVMFVHFPHVDNVGHMSGWGTPEQVAAVEDADVAVGRVLRALEDAGLAQSTLVILSADHGGAGRNHGADDPRSRHIPWIAAGPGIRRDLDLTRYANLTINTEDTFATACYFLGMTPSPRIDGKPVREIVLREELLQAAR